MTRPAAVLPSMASRVARALLGWAVVWGVALALAAWWVVHHEMAEMQDDSLHAAAEAFAWPLSLTPPPPALAAPDLPAAPAGAATPPVRSAETGAHDPTRFVWQRVQQGPVAVVLQASLGAPTAALLAQPVAGLSDADGWRVHSSPLPTPGQWLLVAQASHERDETQREAAQAVAVVTLPMAALGLLWLRQRVRRELVPLRNLSLRLAAHDPLAPGATLGPAERRELAAVHVAVDTLSARLAQRAARERAFTAHAAHALRTPLAGIDAQLAVALREAPATLQPRLQRVRDASGRLQRVLAALLTLFRSDQPLQRALLDLPALAARLPVPGLAVLALPGQPVHADADLVTAALLNLLDNAVRHGAHQVCLSTPQPDVILVQDDGPGVPAARLQALRHGLGQALALAPAASTDNRSTPALGLGLMLAEMVARAHGGSLRLPEVAHGFAVELHLGPAVPHAADTPPTSPPT
jgi:signal transduction histidine kinase